MPPPAAVPSQRRWFESSRSEANLLTATLDRLKPSPSRPLDTADRWRSEQDWHESSNFEENTAQRNFGFDLAPGAERRKPREFSPEIRPEQPKSFADKFKIPDFKSILRMDTVVNPAFKSSFDINFQQRRIMISWSILVTLLSLFVSRALSFYTLTDFSPTVLGQEKPPRFFVIL